MDDGSREKAVVCGLKEISERGLAKDDGTKDSCNILQLQKATGSLNKIYT